MTSKEVLEFAKKNDAKQLDLRFTDIPSLQHHVSYPISELDESSFEDGFGMDGSSIRGWAAIHESDMLLIPDPETALMDPFAETPTLVMIGDVQDPITKQRYERDPRWIARKAELYLTNSGVADTAYFGAEAEFFIFDNVSFDQNQHEGYYFIDAEEGRWNSGRRENNLGYRPRYKEGYFPVPPTDHYQDLRSEMVQTMIQCGLHIECHHHEVATGGQAEIDQRFDKLVKSADNMMLYKYIVRNTANQYGKTVTFMPKPLFADNGSGMHTHQSLWKGGKPLFAGDGYAGFSQLGLHYIGGIAEARAGAVGDHRADDEQLQAAGAGVRSAGEPGVLAAEPVGGVPDPDVLGESEGEAGGVPAAGHVGEPVPGVRGDADGGFGRGIEQDEPGRAAGQGHLRSVAGGDEGGAVDAGIFGRGAELPGRGPRVPAARRRVQRRADPDVHRLQAQERSRSRPPAPAPVRIRAVLRRVDENRFKPRMNTDQHR